MTTEKLLTEWLENYERENVKVSTYIRYCGLVLWFPLTRSCSPRCTSARATRSRLAR